MAQLQTSGAISLNEIHQNIGGTSGTTVSLNDTDVKELIFRDNSTNNSSSVSGDTLAMSGSPEPAVNPRKQSRG